MTGKSPHTKTHTQVGFGVAAVQRLASCIEACCGCYHSTTTSFFSRSPSNTHSLSPTLTQSYFLLSFCLTSSLSLLLPLWFPWWQLCAAEITLIWEWDRRSFSLLYTNTRAHTHQLPLHMSFYECALCLPSPSHQLTHTHTYTQTHTHSPCVQSCCWPWLPRVPYLPANTPNWFGFHITLCYWIMLSEKLDQFCWCLLLWTDRGREGGRASADLERRTSWWTADWSGVTCDWTAEWAGHRLLARLCCPFVLPPEYHHPSTLTLRNSPITQWYRRLGSATKSTRAHTHTQSHVSISAEHYICTYMQRDVETFCVSV